MRRDPKAPTQMSKQLPQLPRAAYEHIATNCASMRYDKAACVIL